MAHPENQPELPKMFVINLLEDGARRRYARDQLESLGADFEIVKAVSASELTDDHYAVYDDQALHQRVNRSLTPGELACVFSHAAVWHRVLDEGHDTAIILEDDAVLGEDFAVIAASLAQLPAGWGILNLCSSLGQFEVIQPEFIPGRALTRFRGNMNGTVAYAVSRPGVETLLRHLLPVRAAADGLLSSMTRSGQLVSCGITPEVVTHSTAFDSNIGRRR